jgi:tetratricopeptide (TPR) repeat protein
MKGKEWQGLQHITTRLESWKEIATYLNRHLTTVRRWERREGLPVHRHMHLKLGSVYAYAEELDAWINRRRGLPLRDGPPKVATMPMGPLHLPTTATVCVREGSVRLLGRETELRVLDEAWNRAREGQQQLVVISGEPGTGKTRLVSEFAHSISHTGSVLAGRCDRPPHLPFSPFVEILQDILRHGKDLWNLLPGIEASDELAHLVPQVSKFVRPTACPPATPEGHRFRMFEAFAGLLRAIAQGGPVLLVIEDVHWADEASMLLLRHLVRSTRDAALCIAVTWCEAELPQVRWRTELLADLRKETSTTPVELGGLPDDGICCFIDECTGRSAPANLIRFVTETTQGNPLFMTEMLRHLSETGAMSHLDVLAKNGDFADLGVPESIQEVIGRRISRLSETCKTLLTVASVAGRDFSLAIAEEVTDLPENVVLDAADEAVVAKILREVAGAPGRFSFTHTLIREVLYSQQTAVRRARLHHRLAEVIEQRAELDNLPVLELACHFGQAAVHGDARKAVDYAVLAAERAAAALAIEEAARFYKVALDAIQFLPVDAETRRKRFELHAKRGRSFFQAGHWGKAKDDLEAATALTETHNEEERSELYIDLAEASFWLMDVPGVRRYAAEAQRLADATGRTDVSADALAWTASAQVADGDISGALKTDRRAVAKVGGIRSFGLARVPLTLYWAGRTAEAVAQARQAVDCARDSDDPAFLLYALQHLGLSLSGIGEYDEALRVFDEACSFGRTCGALPLLARAMCMSVAPLFSLGDLEAARTRALEARELARRVSFEPPLVSAGLDLLLISARLHDPGSSESLLRETHAALVEARGWHGWKWRLRLAQAQAELALARGCWNEAVTAASDVVDQSRSHGRPKYQALGLAERARASSRLGLRRAGADALAAVEIARRIGDPAVLFECLSAALEVHGTDELLIEAQNTLQRMAGTISKEPYRARFLANVSSRETLISISLRRSADPTRPKTLTFKNP